MVRVLYFINVNYFYTLLVIRATTIPALRDYVTKFGEDAVRLFQTLEEGLRICEFVDFFASLTYLIYFVCSQLEL